ncbi:MAG: hypothetical protein KC933_30305 [Myxococcales bacterium]|nr:hypothetical protein [Myxococcales bacterium]MCB9652281.1 hypothetical protein [Deltaproteobacteria bacterium]
MSTAETFTDLVKKRARAEDISAHLDALGPAERVRECMALPGNLQPALFELAKGSSKLDVHDFVGQPCLTAIYELKNNLPVFNISQKRFYRPEEGEVVGYNHTTGLAATFAGPGYFFAVNGDDGELVFDYTRLPTLQPEGWPEIRPNTGLIPGLTYGEMLDYVRQVSAHTVIGAAYRKGKPRNAYFLLTRAAAQS